MFIVEIAGHDHAFWEHDDAYSSSSSAFLAGGSPFCRARSALASATRSLNCSPASKATSDTVSIRYSPPLITSLAKGRNADPMLERMSAIGVSPLHEIRFDLLIFRCRILTLHRPHRPQSTCLRTGFLCENKFIRRRRKGEREDLAGLQTQDAANVA